MDLIKNHIEYFVRLCNKNNIHNNTYYYIEYVFYSCTPTNMFIISKLVIKINGFVYLMLKIKRQPTLTCDSVIPRA